MHSPNEHNTQRIENEAIKTNRTVEHFWDVLVFDVAFLFWVLSIFGSSLFLRLSKKNVGSFSFLRWSSKVVNSESHWTKKWGEILPEISWGYQENSIYVVQSLPILHIPGDKTETHIHTDRRIHKNLNLLTKAAFNAAS